MPLQDVDVSVNIELMDGSRIATLASGFRNEKFSVPAGAGTFVCRVAGLPLRPDTYSLNVFLGGNHAFYDHVERAISFDIAPHDVYGTGKMPQRNEGALITEYHWRALEPDAKSNVV
jgi:hypothetical protein